MEVGKINSINTNKSALRQTNPCTSKCVAFKAAPPAPSYSNNSKKFWLILRQLANEMKDITEIKNAVIAAIGTGIIAPAIILVSPGKGDEEDKNKKFIQTAAVPSKAPEW